MKTDIELVSSLDDTVWREFVDQHPLGNIFHTPEMYQVFTLAKGHCPRLEAAVNCNGEILALLLPVELTLIGGLFHLLTTRAIVYGSALCCPNLQGTRGLEFLLYTYTRKVKHQVLFTEMRNLANLNHLQGVYEQHGFTYSDHLNYLIDLRNSPEQILQRVGRRTRKHIRQGLRKGKIQAEIITERRQLTLWYELVRKSYREAMVPLADLSLFEAAFDILWPKGMIQFWLGRIYSNYIAASAELLYKDVIFGWYSGVDRTFASELPGEMLMWHILSWGAQNGYKLYDFGGAGKPNEEYGVRDFKAKFGGKLVCYGRNTNVSSPLLFHLSTLGYRFLTRYRLLGWRFLNKKGVVYEDNIIQNPYVDELG